MPAIPQTDRPYRGRFAPSPTGPLHLGSLIAALASYLDARHHRGLWLLRMEDLDPPREEAGAAARILASLEAHGLHWDGEVLWQSRRGDAYSAALAELERGHHLFRCDCSRQQLGPGGACRGHCRHRQTQLGSPAATRLAVPADCRITFRDRIQGQQDVPLGRELPDFVVRRKDGLHAYQLAVVVDDAWQGVTHVVRGSDLLDSTGRQILLQQLLGHRTPCYGHLPVITDAAGHKLSKQTHAPPLQDDRVGDNLRAALRFLHQPPPPLEAETVADILAWACANWRLEAVPAVLGIHGVPTR